MKPLGLPFPGLKARFDRARTILAKSEQERERELMAAIARGQVIRVRSVRCDMVTDADALRQERHLREITSGEPISVRLLATSEPAPPVCRGWRRVLLAFLALFHTGAGK